ncbi:MAG: hypothetical protein LRY68_10565 [Sulfurospirillum sp.]|nr:hypothetical protein [Sulfurospirillum sp.]
MNKSSNKKNIEYTSFAVLLGFSTFFGFLENSSAMGLSILAGSIGLAFVNIDKISKFKGAGFEAEMRDQQIGAIIEKETEPEKSNENADETADIKTYSELTQVQKDVLIALNNPNYTWRSLTGIATDTQRTTNTIYQTLKYLMDNSLVQSSGGHKSLKWALTIEGRKIISILQDNEKNSVEQY